MFPLNPSTPNTRWYIWTYTTQGNEGNTVKCKFDEEGRAEKETQKKKNTISTANNGVHPKLGHLVLWRGYFSPAQLPCNEKTLQALSWKSDKVKQKEAFMCVFCSNYFNLQNAQNSKSPCSALYLGWTFSSTGLIILCQPLGAKYLKQWF